MKKRFLALTLALSLLLSACGSGETTAATMHLRKTEGTVDVSDGEGKALEPAENLGLFSGYEVDTQSESYAWIDLDDVKLTKLDENSQVEIKKEDKHLTIEVKSGSLFFNVTEPLAEDETLDIRTSTMLVGIRGTCGWVTQDTVALLEGTVSVEADGQTVTVNAGEMAVLTAEGTLEVKPFTVRSIPTFVADEVEGNEELEKTVKAVSGIDVPGDESEASASHHSSANSPASYEELLDTLDNVVYSELIDFEQDGSPELLVIRIDAEENSASVVGNDSVSIYRNGPDGVKTLAVGGGNRDSDTVVYSLVESDGKIFVCRDRLRQSDGFPYICFYYGSVAQREGSYEDWGTVDFINQGRVVARDEKGLVSLMELHYEDSEDAGAVRDKYTLVRELVIYNRENITVVG